MTLKKLIKKYMRIQKLGYETMTIAQVINDLRQVGSIGKSTEKKEENDPDRS